tara:strand:- start:421 stop:639 length:219 start_codon:yes stop_codon:yes gene_type:complete
LNWNITQLPNINKIIEIRSRFILSSKGFLLIRKILKTKDSNKKKDAIAGAENKRNIPILKLENPIVFGFNFL